MPEELVKVVYPGPNVPECDRRSTIFSSRLNLSLGPDEDGNPKVHEIPKEAAEVLIAGGTVAPYTDPAPARASVDKDKATTDKPKNTRGRDAAGTE